MTIGLLILGAFFLFVAYQAGKGSGYREGWFHGAEEGVKRGGEMGYDHGFMEGSRVAREVAEK